MQHDGETQRQTIAPMETSSIRRLTAGQAVTDLASAVKELVDNALDAGATCINIRLWDSGTKILEVSDDGRGIPLESRPYVAIKNATSKIRNFEDIYSHANTLGFRGEALFCLANISQELLVSTRTAFDELGQRLAFGRDGYLDPESVCQVPRKIGTTVAVVGLFDALPVRKADMIKRIKKQRSKMLKMMQGYAVLCTGVRFNLMDIIGPGNRESKILATSSGSITLEHTVSSALGSRFLRGVTRLSVDLTAVVGGDGISDNQWKVEGLVSKSPANAGRNEPPARDLQFFSINHRPVELPRISRALNEAWRALEGSNTKRPACVLCFSLPNNAFDINLSPDKREVFLRDEAGICELIREAVTSIWSSMNDAAFPANEVELISQTQESTQHAAAVTQSESPGSPRRRRARRRMAFVNDLSTACMQHEGGDRMEALQGTVVHGEGSIGGTDHGIELDANPLASCEASNESQAMSITQVEPVESVPRMDMPSDRERINWSQTQVQFNRINRDDGTTQTEEINILNKQDDPPSPPTADNALSEEPSRSQPGPSTIGHTKEAPSRSRDGSSSSRSRPLLGGLEQFAFTSGTEQTSVLKRKADAAIGNERPAKESRPSERGTPKSTETVDLGGVASMLVTPEESNTEPAGRGLSSEQRKGAPVVLMRSSKPHNEVDNGDERAMDCSDEETEDSPARPRKLQRRGSGSDAGAAAARTTVVWNSFIGAEQVMEAAKTARLSMREQRRSLQKDIQLRTPTNEIEADARVDVDNVSERAASHDNDVVGFAKSDFADMEIIGQFNLGFILARCRNNHLWILDQHACDEKARFERLCATTKIHEQKLIAPMPLELSPSEESCILDHMEIFEENGFRFSYDSEKEPRHRLALTALPHSGAPDGRKAVQFGKEDVRALCAMLGEEDDPSENGAGGDGHGTGADGSGVYGNNAVRRYAGGLSQRDKASAGSNGGSIAENSNAKKIIKRLPKAIAMFASRACRGSIMIGTALSQREMDAIVKKLAGVESPWNCPHGRPTMRHVKDLAPTLMEDEKRAEVHVAGPTLAALSQFQEGGADQEEEEE